MWVFTNSWSNDALYHLSQRRDKYVIGDNGYIQDNSSVVLFLTV